MTELSIILLQVCVFQATCNRYQNLKANKSFCKTRQNLRTTSLPGTPDDAVLGAAAFGAAAFGVAFGVALAAAAAGLAVFEVSGPVSTDKSKALAAYCMAQRFVHTKCKGEYKQGNKKVYINR